MSYEDDMIRFRQHRTETRKLVVHNMRQGSEEWDAIRRGKATASCFDRIVTPAKLQFGSGAKSYACEKVAEILGVDSTPPPPSFWMERGIEMEPFARQELSERLGQTITEVGFIQPFEGARWGCSLDGIVADGTIIETKCPKAETLIGYHAAEVLPAEYRIQVQAELWMTGSSCCHFMAWHPEIEPFYIPVYPDQFCFDAFELALPEFIALVDSILAKVTRRANQHPTARQLDNHMVTYGGEE